MLHKKSAHTEREQNSESWPTLSDLRHFLPILICQPEVHMVSPAQRKTQLRRAAWVQKNPFRCPGVSCRDSLGLMVMDVSISAGSNLWISAEEIATLANSATSYGE
jgi:hypothetical protein